MIVLYMEYLQSSKPTDAEGSKKRKSDNQAQRGLWPAVVRGCYELYKVVDKCMKAEKQVKKK